MLEKKLEKVNEVRKKILNMVMRSGEGHIASSFSIVEMLLAIFYDMKILNNSFKNNNLILSKGHASYAYYAVLSHLGMMSEQEVLEVGKLGSKFYGHLPYIPNDMRFSFGSGSLGHGLPFALGLSTANSLLGKNDWVYCLVGDGEANEGTFWETMLLSEKYCDSKLKILIDCNGSSERAIPILDVLSNLGNVFKKISISKCNGHNISEIQKSLSTGLNIRVALCETIKGFPSKLMSNNPVWHHKIPNDKEAELILKDLE